MSTKDPFTTAARKITDRVFAAKKAAPTDRTIKVYEFKEEKIVGAFIDGIPEAVRFGKLQIIRGRLVKTDNITRVHVITTPSGDMYSLPVDSVRVDQSSQGTA